MPRARRPDYDADQFRTLWWDTSVQLQSIAKRYGVSSVAVLRAGQRRGFPNRKTL